MDFQSCSWKSPYRTSKNVDYLQIEVCQSQTQKKQRHCGSNCLWSLLKNISRLIHQCFGQVFIVRFRVMANKGLMKSLPTKLTDLEEPWPICILTKATEIPIGPNIYASNFSSGLMLQMDFVFFNVGIIHGFTCIFVAICFATSYPFGFTSRSKISPLDILKF